MKVSLALLLIVLVLAGCSLFPPAPLAETPEPTIVGASTRALPTLLPSAFPTAPAVASPTPASSATPTRPPAPDIPTELSAERRYAIPLRLQHLGSDVAEALFALDQPVDAWAAIWPAGSPELAVLAELEPAQGTLRVTFDGLQPDAAYELQVAVRDADGVWRLPAYESDAWGPISLRTHAETTAGLKVAVIGDSGFGEPLTARLVEQMMEHSPDMVIHTGDLVYRAYEEGDPAMAFAAKFFSPFRPALERVPVYAVIGNHDTESHVFYAGRPFYEQVFPPLERQQPLAERWSAFTVGEVQFILLDSQVFYNTPGREAQTSFLAERLADPLPAYSVVIFHIAPYTSGLHGNDGAPIRAAWRDLLVNAGVPLVLSGHDHNYERLLVDGIVYLVSGGGSSSLYSSSGRLAFSQVFAAEPHYVLLDWVQAGIRGRAVGLGGEILDDFFIAQ
jgi:predicted phosphodiesterase